MKLHTIEDHVERVSDVEAVLKDGDRVRHHPKTLQVQSKEIRLTENMCLVCISRVFA